MAKNAWEMHLLQKPRQEESRLGEALRKAYMVNMFESFSIMNRPQEWRRPDDNKRQKQGQGKQS